jgi:hypothetical protein
LVASTLRKMLLFPGVPVCKLADKP